MMVDHGRSSFAAGTMLLGMLCALGIDATCEADLIWKNHFTDEQSILNGAGITTPGGTNVTFGRTVYSDNTGGTFDLDPHINSDYLTFESGKMGGETGYLEFSLDNQDNDPDDFVELALNFDQTVSDLQFSLLDVDSTNAWDDGFEVYYNGSNNVRDNPGITVVTGTHNAIDDESYMHGWEGVGKNAGNGNLDANIVFDFGSLEITSLTFRFFSTDDAKSNPNGQRAGLCDLTFNQAVPEASSLACMSLFGLFLLLSLRRRSQSRQAGPSSKRAAAETPTLHSPTQIHVRGRPRESAAVVRVPSARRPQVSFPAEAA